ncbi:MAG: hypothetical protein ACRDP6_43730, partial [Actinoallomurus sp.]
PAPAAPAAYDPGAYGPGPGSYNAGQDTGSYPAPPDNGTFRTPAYDTGPNNYQPGPPSPYETPHRTDSFDTGHQAPAPSGDRDGGLGSGFGDSSFAGPDTGQWSLPPAKEAGSRPALPKRHTDAPADEPVVHEPVVHEPVADEPVAGLRRSVFEPAPDSPSGRDQAPADPVPDTAAPPASDGGLGRPSLPRRVRQANLAPQLREEVEPVSDTASGERSPEELRTMLSSIQKGWLRGRSDSDDTATGHEEEDI